MSDIKLSEIIEAAAHEKPAIIKEKINEILREKVTAIIEAKREEVVANMFNDDEDSEEEVVGEAKKKKEKEDDDKEDDDDEDEDDDKEDKKEVKEASDEPKKGDLYHHPKHGVIKFSHYNSNGKKVFDKAGNSRTKSWPFTVSDESKLKRHTV